MEGWTSNRRSASDALADIGHSSPFVFVLRSAEFLGKSDEKPFRPTDVAEPIRVFILDYFAYELRAEGARTSCARGRSRGSSPYSALE